MNHTLAPDDFPLTARTSAIAVLSLVCGLICLVPGTGLLGVVLGIAALLLIDRSQGRLRGTGLAIGGIVLGFLATLVWVGIVIGLGQFSGKLGKQFMKPIGSIFQSVEAGDFAAARAAFDPGVAANLDDEHFIAFRTAYQASAGTFVEMPDTLAKMFSAWPEVAPAMQGFNKAGVNNLIPIPARFQNGMAVAVVRFPQNVSQPPPSGTWVPHLLNLGVLTTSGQEVWLVGPTTPLGTPVPLPSQPQNAPPPAPEPAGGGPDGG